MCLIKKVTVVGYIMIINLRNAGCQCGGGRAFILMVTSRCSGILKSKIRQWGNIPPVAVSSLFYNCANLMNIVFMSMHVAKTTPNKGPVPPSNFVFSHSTPGEEGSCFLCVYLYTADSTWQLDHPLTLIHKTFPVLPCWTFALWEIHFW